jgi:hypothetical protein
LLVTLEPPAPEIIDHRRRDISGRRLAAIVQEAGDEGGAFQEQIASTMSRVSPMRPTDAAWRGTRVFRERASVSV